MPKMRERRNWESRRKQQYQCKNCQKKFITEQNYSKEFKQKAIEIFYEGNSGRAVGRIIGINKSTVYNWRECPTCEYARPRADEALFKASSEPALTLAYT